jgi:hypothetical protein
MELATPDTRASQSAPTRPASPVALEQAFHDAETQLAASGKAATGLAKALKSAIAAAKAGDVRALSKAVQAAQAALRDVHPGLQGANKTLEIDFAAALRGGAFAEEIIRTAERAGLRGVRHIHGAVLSFPVALFPNAETLAVRYGKKTSSSLRPSAVVAQLQELRKQQRPARALQKLVDAIEHAYFIRTQKRLGVPVPIQAIYELLTPLPDQRNEYTDIDFVADLYSLERASALKSSDNHRLSFPASTSTKFKKSIRIATEDGEERLYSSIRFDK